MNADELFAAALECGDAAARVALLDRECAGNAPLRAEVESLLGAHDGAEQFMQTEAMPEPGPLVDAEPAGARIGRYKLLEQIGEGGFGTVWLAEQEEPVRRRVALKIIKLGMDTKEVVARFEAERQALALMDHPNIARVYDGGATETGRPYFVMELVRGVPITKYCDEHRLTVKERLELFIQVCQAVQHAHQKGIIHRDIKPNNVLVSVVDDRAVPKVIDFGIAKATAQRLTEKTVFTRFNQFIGTPAYMSPEQAGANREDIDTRSDIYSLGVLLYELLTGRTPFDTKKLLDAGYEAILKTIREQEPPKPSTRLTGLTDEDLSTVAASRRIPPAKLGRAMRGELDWIVMKAMEKDRGRRYPTAQGLARDIQRHLQHESVEASPPSLRYRTGKLIARYRLAAALVLSVTVILTAATGVSLRLAIIAREARVAEQKERARAERVAFDALTRSGLSAESIGKHAEAMVWFAAAAERGYGSPAEVSEAIARVVNAKAPLDVPVAAFREHERQILRLRFHPSGHWLAAFSPDAPPIVWDLLSHTPLTLPDSTTAVGWDAKGERLLVARSEVEPELQVLSFPALKLMQRVAVPAPATAVAFVPQSSEFMAAGPGFVQFAGEGETSASTPLPSDGPSPKPFELRFNRAGNRLLICDLSGTFLRMERLDTTWIAGSQWFGRRNNNATDTMGGSFSRAGFLADDRTAVTLAGNHLMTVQPDGVTNLLGSALLGNVSTFTVSSSGKWIAVGGFKQKLLVDLEEPGRVITLPAPNNSASCFAFEPAERAIFAGTWDPGADFSIIGDPSAKSYPVGVHQRNVTAVEASPDGKLLATAQLGGLVRVWRVDGRYAVVGADGNINQTRVEFSPGGDHLLLKGASYRGAYNFAVIRAEMGEAARETTLLHTNRLVVDATHSASGNTIAVALAGAEFDPANPSRRTDRASTMFTPESGGSILLLESASGRVVAGPFGLPMEPRSIAFKPGSDRELAVLCAGGQIVRISGTTGSSSILHEAHARRVNNHYTNNGLLRSEPESNALISWGIDNSVRAFDWDTGKVLFPAIDLGALCHDVRLTPDGKILATAGFDRKVRFWEFPSGRESSFAPLMHADWVFEASFSPDGALLATACRDRAARVWRWRDGVLAFPPLRHEDEVKCAVFTADGEVIATAGYDRTVRLWSARSGYPVAPPAPGFATWDMAVSPDGRLLAFGGDFPGARILLVPETLPPDRLTAEQAITLACIVSAQKFDPTGGPTAITEEDWLEAWRAGLADLKIRNLIAREWR